jgi:hypothetical protein
MNSHLSHQMANLHQQDLQRKAERVRIERAGSGYGRPSALRQLTLGFSRRQAQSQPARPVASATSRI